MIAFLVMWLAMAGQGGTKKIVDAYWEGPQLPCSVGIYKPDRLITWAEFKRTGIRTCRPGYRLIFLEHESCRQDEMCKEKDYKPRCIRKDLN